MRYTIKNQKKDYKEYIEKWIHEVKTPISAIKLIEENNKTSTSRLVLQELEEIDYIYINIQLLAI